MTVGRPYLDPVDAGIALRVHAAPRASRTEIAGAHGDRLKIRLAAPPVDGAANDELIRFVAELFAVPKADVALVRGHGSRRKDVHVTGVGLTEAEERIDGVS